MAARLEQSCIASSDDWQLIEDPKIRKRVQDRLAQRGRRKRLREAKQARHSQHGNAAQSHTSNDATTGVGFVLSDGARMLDSEHVLGLLPKAKMPTYVTPTGQQISLDYEIPAPITVFGALFINGKVLGLSCFSTIASKSAPAGIDVPGPLQPTEVQLTTVHLNGIDRFPFPQMRDNFITLGPVIDEEEFSMDLFTMPSFTIKPGRPSWDPEAWEIAPCFADKWGFLFV